MKRGTVFATALAAAALTFPAGASADVTAPAVPDSGTRGATGELDLTADKRGCGTSAATATTAWPPRSPRATPSRSPPRASPQPQPLWASPQPRAPPRPQPLWASPQPRAPSPVPEGEQRAVRQGRNQPRSERGVLVPAPPLPLARCKSRDDGGPAPRRAFVVEGAVPAPRRCRRPRVRSRSRGRCPGSRTSSRSRRSSTRRLRTPSPGSSPRTRACRRTRGSCRRDRRTRPRRSRRPRSHPRTRAHRSCRPGASQLLLEMSQRA